MLLLPSTFLVFSEGEFLLNSQTEFFLDSYLFQDLHYYGTWVLGQKPS